MAKIERKFLAHFVNASKDEQPEYERLGKDLEEFSAEISAQVESKKNILGQTAVAVTGYEKTAAVEPYYAEADSKLFARLQDIIDRGLVLEDVKTDVVEVKLWEPDQEGAYPAVKEAAYIGITSYGGDTAGYKIAFTLHFTGEKVMGRFNPATKTFTVE